ncbi:MAG: hypothetical protein Q8Q10_00280 [bacterium]|nr:hypothetical protein [bacterium]
MYTLRAFFRDREVVSPKAGLEKRILAAVLAVKNREMKRRLMIAYVGIVSSLGALAYASLIFGKPLIESEFWNVLPLVFSDLTVIVRYSNDFFLSLLETFPAFPVAFVLLPIFILFMFLNMYAGAQKNHYGFNH